MVMCGLRLREGGVGLRRRLCPFLRLWGYAILVCVILEEWVDGGMPISPQDLLNINLVVQKTGLPSTHCSLVILSMRERVQVKWFPFGSSPRSSRVQTAVGLPEDIESALQEFANGVDGVVPNGLAVAAARQLAGAATATAFPEITVDIDGALSFDLRLRDGSLLLAELTAEGALDASVYGGDNNLLRRIPEATVEEICSLLSAS